MSVDKMAYSEAFDSDASAARSLPASRQTATELWIMKLV